jgi:hypothetical protein
MTCWALLETFEGMPNGDFQDGQTAFQSFDLCLCAPDPSSLFALRGERLASLAAVSSGATREHTSLPPRKSVRASLSFLSTED